MGEWRWRRDLGGHGRGGCRYVFSCTIPLPLVKSLPRAAYLDSDVQQAWPATPSLYLTSRLNFSRVHPPNYYPPLSPTSNCLPRKRAQVRVARPVRPLSTRFAIRASATSALRARSSALTRCFLLCPSAHKLVQAAARAGEQDHELQRGNQKKTLPFTPWAPLADSTRGHAERRPPHRAPGRVLLVALDAPAPPSALLSATDYLLFHSSVRDHAPAAVPRPLPVARPTARACCAW